MSWVWQPLPAAQADAGGAFTLDALPGSYTITGSAASLVAGRVISSVPGAYTITGVAAATVAGRAVNAVPGTYLLTGQPAGLVAARVLSLTPGVYAVTGVNAALVAGRVLTAVPGVYLITGFAAELATVGSFSLVARPARYAVTGAAASTVAGRVIVADDGVYVITGANAGLIADRMLSALPGAYLVTGAAASLVLSVGGLPGTIVGGDRSDTQVFGATRTATVLLAATGPPLMLPVATEGATPEMGLYQLGNQVTIFETFTVEGVPTDPTTVTFTVELPDQTVETFVDGTDPEVTNPSVVYELPYTPATAGVYQYNVVGAGAVVATSPTGSFTVLADAISSEPGPCEPWISADDVAECCGVETTSTFLFDSAAYQAQPSCTSCRDGSSGVLRLQDGPARLRSCCAATRSSPGAM